MELISTKDLTVIYQGCYEDKTIIYNNYYGCIAYAEVEHISNDVTDEHKFIFNLHYCNSYAKHTNYVHQYDRQIKKAFREIANKFTVNQTIVNYLGLDDKQYTYVKVEFNQE